MARHLTLVTTLISQYLLTRFPTGIVVTHKIPASSSRATLPTQLYIAFLQGEALLRLKFFSYLQERSITDPDSLAKLWRQLIDDKRYIQQVAEKSGLLDYFVFAAAGEGDTDKVIYGEQCFTAYCILLFDAHETGNVNLVQGLTKGFVVHFMPTLYPAQAKITDTQLLKREIAKQLALRWNIRPEIKESFVISDEKVTFSLIAKLPRMAPLILITVEGARLKPTRLMCYQKALERLEHNVLIIDLPLSLLPKK